MAVDFSKILKKQTAEIEKPVPLPIGTYLCNNPALPKFEAVGKKETPAAIFSLVVLNAQDDVDQEELSKIKDWQGKGIRHTVWLSDDALFRAKEQLCQAFQIDEAGKTLGQIFNETINKQVLVTISHRPSDDGTEMYAQVEGLAAA